MATTSDLPRVALYDHEKEEAPSEDDAECYADHETVPPTLVPYVLMGYAPRIQLMVLFTRSKRSLSLAEVHSSVEGEYYEVESQLVYLLNLGVVKEVKVGLYRLDHDNPIAQSLRDLFHSLEREADDMDPEDYVK